MKNRSERQCGICKSKLVEYIVHRCIHCQRAVCRTCFYPSWRECVDCCNETTGGPVFDAAPNDLSNVIGKNK